MNAEGIVVVGGGIAGLAVCEALRERDREVPVTLVCGEPRLPYDRVRLSELLISGDEADTLELRPAAWFAEHGVATRLGRWVERIDLEERAVVLDGGERLPYGTLVLATGSRPLLPPIPGIDLPGVHAFRGPEDCTAIRAGARRARRAAVIGGGLLGLEAAKGVVEQGCPVTVVHLLDRLMERQLDASAAGMVLPALAAQGIDVALERQTVELRGEERVSALRFADGGELAADLVVVSIGIRPEVTLARDAGLRVGRGIVVDDALRTSADEVLAVGECAEHRGVVHGLVAPIREQARVAAATLLGRAAVYAGSVPSAKLKVAGLDLVAAGAAEGEAAAVVADAEAGVYRKLVVSGGRAAGAILLGDARGAQALLAAVRSGEPVDDPLAALQDASRVSAVDLPPEAQVCDCNGVCKAQIEAAVTEGGCATPREVMAATRAGTGCGSCKAAVIDIVAEAAGGLSDEPAYLCPCRRLTRDEVVRTVRENGLASVSEVAAACGAGRDCGACKPALAYLVSEVNANRHREERDARFINDRVHANIQNDGTFSVVPRMYGGVTTPDELRRIADVAERYGARMVKVTGGQRIDLLGIRKQDLPAVWRDLGMPSGHAYAKAVRTVKTCVGSDFCRFGVGDSIALGIALERAWEGLHTPAKVKGGVSGCRRNCAEATIKDVGVLALEGGRWEIRVGGAAGASVREADVLCQVGSPDEVLAVSTALLQLYREEGEYKERLYDFVPRWGLDRIRETVLDPQRAAALRERFAIAKAAVADPWLERDAPYHPRQFAELDLVHPEPDGDDPPAGDAGLAAAAVDGGRRAEEVLPS